MTLKKLARAGLIAARVECARRRLLRLGADVRPFVGLRAGPGGSRRRHPPTRLRRTRRRPLAPPMPTPPKAVLENCTPNSGDTAWMLTSVALVLMMTIPGLGLFYGGMVRKKNVGDTVMTSFAITCLVTILWVVCTYSMAFTAGSPYIGGLSRAFLQGIVSDIAKGIGNPNPLAATIPETVYICFQMTFAIITPALIAGAFAERMKFSAMLWFIGLWAIVVYAPIAHWVWGPDGFMTAGNSDGLHQGARLRRRHGGAHQRRRRRPDVRLMLGKRKDIGPPHNMVLTFIGASLLWVGWFGFNAGSAVTAGMQAGMAMLGDPDRDRGRPRFTWMFVEWVMRGKPTVIGICSGAVAGLVAITPASGFVGPVGSIVHRRRGRRRSATGASPASSTCSAMTTRSMPSACTRSAASSARCSPACSRSSNTAAPPACSKAMRSRSSTRPRASASCSSTTPSSR